MTGGKFKDVKGALLAPVERAGLPKITWHTFRHTFASRLTRDGVDLVTVKDLPGHSNISTTLRYAHSNDEAKRRAVDKPRNGDEIVAVVGCLTVLGEPRARGDRASRGELEIMLDFWLKNI
jgi:hypothetical protein